jgi:hypothetical protein
MHTALDTADARIDTAIKRRDAAQLAVGNDYSPHNRCLVLAADHELIEGIRERNACPGATDTWYNADAVRADIAKARNRARENRNEAASVGTKRKRNEAASFGTERSPPVCALDADGVVYQPGEKRTEICAPAPDEDIFIAYGARVSKVGQKLTRAGVKVFVCDGCGGTIPMLYAPKDGYTDGAFMTVARITNIRDPATYDPIKVTVANLQEIKGVCQPGQAWQGGFEEMTILGDDEDYCAACAAEKDIVIHTGPVYHTLCETTEPYDCENQRHTEWATHAFGGRHTHFV